MKTLKIILIVLLALLVLAAGGGAYGAYRVSQLDTNYPNLSVNGIPVGGLTREQTVEALNAAGWETRLSTPLTVTTLGGQSFTVDPLKSGVLQTTEGIAEIAFQYGREGNIIEDLISYLKCRFKPTELEHPEQNADRAYLAECIAQNRADLETLLGEAEYVPDYEGEKLVLRKGWGQLQLDEEGLTEAIIAALQAGVHEISYDRLAAELTEPDFDAIHAELLKEPKDASFTDDGKFDVIDEVVGCRFDVQQAKELWEAAAPTDEVDVPMSVTWPAVTGQQLRDSLFHDLLGTCTTNYWNSTDNRINNVKLASSKIDGTILYPGDVFSYNEVVGQRTQEAGFLPAPAYVDGDVKDEIGGGACQVSSTLYCATLFAFLETVERTNHYFPVHYMQLGTDATVTIPDEGGNVMDLKFRNNKNYPIKIVAYSTVDEENYFRDLTFEIWGTLEDGDYMPVVFDNRNPWGWEFSNHIWEVEPPYPDRPGYTVKLTHESYYFEDDIGEGTRTLTYRRVYDENGELVSDELLNPLLPSGGAAMDTYYDHN
ncbi:MAG: VanW family protein [Oscillospiraceae bacterium]|nr:VanW family protein [Oscillospiraceae bacterium]